MEETIEILNNIKNKYEDYHNVTYSQDAIEACVKLSDRYMTDQLLPDKAIDMYWMKWAFASTSKHQCA